MGSGEGGVGGAKEAVSTLVPFALPPVTWNRLHGPTFLSLMQRETLHSPRANPAERVSGSPQVAHRTEPAGAKFGQTQFLTTGSSQLPLPGFHSGEWHFRL